MVDNEKLLGLSRINRDVINTTSFRSSAWMPKEPRVEFTPIPRLLYLELENELK
jgi:hypothetical protein